MDIIKTVITKVDDSTIASEDTATTISEYPYDNLIRDKAYWEGQIKAFTNAVNKKIAAIDILLAECVKLDVKSKADVKETPVAEDVKL